MIQRINRLRAKRGFTMIELVVVMLIIGVLTAIIVSAMTYDSKPTKGKAMAKDMFYAVQDTMSSLKITNPDLIKDLAGVDSSTGHAKDLIVYCQVDDSGEISSTSLPHLSVSVASEEVGAFVHTNPDGSKVTKAYDFGMIEKSGASYQTTPCGLIAYTWLSVGGHTMDTWSASSEGAFTGKLCRAFKAGITNSENMKGSLIAVVDYNFRVKVAYWTDSTHPSTDGWSQTDTEITPDDRYQGFYWAAYPAKYSLEGRNIFET